MQFRHGDLPGLVHSVLLETGLAPSRLELEITEGVLIGDFSRAVSILRRLKALGVRIAMDDFGTGYSSLSYLQSFPFDKIKIDQAFISNLERNPQSATIIRAVIGLARGLELPVVAEGVETEEQLAFLARESCDEVQGYLIGRPLPIEEYAALTGQPSEGRGSRSRRLIPALDAAFAAPHRPRPRRRHRLARRQRQRRAIDRRRRRLSACPSHAHAPEAARPAYDREQTYNAELSVGDLPVRQRARAPAWWWATSCSTPPR